MLQIAPGPIEEALPDIGREPAIGDHAIIGDCRTAALVSQDGAIDWLCLPHFSGPSVFAALLDRRNGGHFTIAPRGPFTASRRYLGATPVLETTFRTAEGSFRLTDAMPVAGPADRLRPQREILRVVEGLEGALDLHLVFEPRPEYARARPRIERRGALGCACVWGSEILFLRSDAPLEVSADGRRADGILRVAAGERRALSLSYVKDDIGVVPPLGPEADERLARTLEWWTAWASDCAYAGP
jgi:Domain of unknown function (DUF5911)